MSDLNYMVRLTDPDMGDTVWTSEGWITLTGKYEVTETFYDCEPGDHAWEDGLMLEIKVGKKRIRVQSIDFEAPLEADL